LLSGSLIGSAIGLVMGAGTGLYQAHAAAEQRAQEQIQSLSLNPRPFRPTVTSSSQGWRPDLKRGSGPLRRLGTETTELPRRRTQTRQNPVEPKPYVPQSRTASFLRLSTIT
jgi:hypothetical protein